MGISESVKERFSIRETELDRESFVAETEEVSECLIKVHLCETQRFYVPESATLNLKLGA